MTAGMVASNSTSVDEAIDMVRAVAYSSGQRLIELSEDIAARKTSLGSRLED